MASGTLNSAKLSRGRCVISTKFIFKSKLGVGVDVESYKPRLVVHYTLQKPGVDFEENYTPVVD